MKEAPETKRDRVSIEAARHELYKTLGTGDKSPFKTMKDLFMAAACVGYHLNRCKPLGRRQQIFSWTIFSPQDDIPLLRALGVAATGDVKVLLDQNELLTIAEEYANGGLSVIEEHLVQAPGDPLLKLAQAVVSGMR